RIHRPRRAKLKLLSHIPPFATPAAHDQRRLGEAITGIEGVGTETASGKPPGKSLEGRCPNRFGTVESDLPAAQVELIEIFIRDTIDAKLVSEIRSAADGGSRR